ncbi:host specificity protein J [Rosenbergiella epipactidis]|uniref:host specificity protein J n=1 Tax=Rosenbergiella epipactidis TaxID=1544694 RepID=UPI001F4E4CFC|nr:host specificity protein J [Rosenbergiella epipactidis]
MILIEDYPIQGSKGGAAKAHTPVEQTDNLLSEAKLKMLLAVCEGEVEGTVTAQQIYLNDTPLANDNGLYNFTGVKWEFRGGTQDQEYIKGMPEIDNELSVGQTITTTNPWTRQFTDISLNAIRIKLSVPAQYQYKDNGDMVGTVTEYAIDLSTDGCSYQTVVQGKFDGKTTSEYQRDHRIDLASGASSSAIRVRRITADSTDTKLVNAFKIFSFAEVIDSKLRYPNTSLLYVEVNSEQFTNGAPKVTVKMKGKLIRVPDNYDPSTRTHSGSWSGNFKWAYSNNPAWVFYDLILDKIYGMGNRVDASMIDKWSLYQIAVYCDDMVSNGAGGTEPRFTCNAYVQSQEEAFTVMQDFAAIFRGITFWGNSQVIVNADVPVDDLEWTYTAANVVDGMFSYAGGSYKNRNTSCQVSYSDPANHYSDTIEAVYDSDLVERYGVQQMSLTAIGCTSQSEAHRRGRWALLSNAKDATVSFSVGLDGHIPLPTSIIGVADPYRAGKQNGGRISAVNGLAITLDREVDFAAGDRLILNLPDGTSQTRTIASIAADKKTITVNTAYKTEPVAGAVWIIDSDNLATQQFRVTSITDNDDGTFTVAAVQYDPNKFRYIDDGVKIQPPPVTVTPTSVMSAPQNIVVTETDHIAQGVTVATLQASWDKVDGAINYTAQWRKDNGDWVNVGLTSAQGFSVQGIYAGVYDVRVRAINAADVSSPWGYAQGVALSGKVGKPGTPVNLLATDDVVWNINLTWAFPDGSGDTAYTELQVATTADGQNPQPLTLVPYPGSNYQHGPMPAGVRRWYRARIIDKIGNKGDWTEFVEGQSSIDASEILGDITNQVLQSEAGKQLTAKIDTNVEGILQNALDNNAIVDHQMVVNGQNRADIISVKTTIADNDHAYAQKFDQIQASVGENTAAISQKATTQFSTDGTGSAVFSVNAGVTYKGTYYSAGMSIGVQVAGDGGVSSQLLFLADRFAVMSQAGGQTYSPFAIQNGQVFINQAFIADGTITSAKIGDYIQSNNYVANVSGWRLNKAGTLENYGSDSSGAMKQTNTTISIKDANGVLRVQIGNLTGVF